MAEAGAARSAQPRRAADRLRKNMAGILARKVSIRFDGGQVRGSAFMDKTPMRRKQVKGIGGAERDRTAGLLVANEALSQLSYSPTTFLSYQRTENPERGSALFPFEGVPPAVKASRRGKRLTTDSCWPKIPRCCGPFPGG